MPDNEFEAAEKRLAAAYEKIEAEKKTEKKPLTYTKFRALLSDTQNHSTLESYSEAHPEIEERTLINLWGSKELKSVKSIRHLTDLSQLDFSEKYGIPRRTIEGWETQSDESHRQATEYMYSFLLFAVLSDLSET